MTILELLNQLRDALLANQVFQTPIANRRRGQWDEYELDAIKRTREGLEILAKFGVPNEAPSRRREIEVEWKHDDTGHRFTKRIPEGAEIPSLPRQTIVTWRLI